MELPSRPGGPMPDLAARGDEMARWQAVDSEENVAGHLPIMLVTR